jgi:hypothetical protein
MNKTVQLIAGAAIAAMAMGTTGSGFLILSATEAVAKSEKGSEKSNEAGSRSQGKSEGKGKGNARRGIANQLKQLNAMCANGNAQKNASKSGNVGRIGSFYDSRHTVKMTETSDAFMAIDTDFGVSLEDMSSDDIRQFAENNFDSTSDEYGLLNGYADARDNMDADWAAAVGTLDLSAVDPDQLEAFIESCDPY